MARVYDRNGRVYEMSTIEAKAAIASGAYFETSTPPPMGVLATPIQTNSMSSLMVAVIEKATGKEYMMRVIDAREAIKTRFFEYAPTKQIPAIVEEAAPSADESSEGTAEASPAEETASTDEGTPPAEAKPEYPALSKNNTKAEIINVLKQYGVIYRQNMTEAQLLAVWQAWLDEHTQE